MVATKDARDAAKVRVLVWVVVVGGLDAKDAWRGLLRCLHRFPQPLLFLRCCSLCDVGGNKPLLPIVDVHPRTATVPAGRICRFCCWQLP